MLLSLIGAGGTGKTEVFKKIKEKHPGWQYFTEGVRHQVPAFGYNNPYEIVDKLGIAAFELMNINSWSVIDPKVNTILNPKVNIVTDRSSIDNYAYYLLHRISKQDFEAETLIRNMAKYYASLTDIFVYFSIGKIPLVSDNMRPESLEYQQKIGLKIDQAIKQLDIPESKIYPLNSISLNERVEEILLLS